MCDEVCVPGCDWSFICVVFRPIFASAKICINPSADIDLKSPKVNLHLEVQNIGIEMTKPQVRLRQTSEMPT